MGRLKSVSVFQEAHTCMGTDFKDPVPCCEDVSDELKITELTKVSFEFDSTPELHQLAVITWILLDQKANSHQKDKPQFSNYLPPPPDRDIPVQIQSFLI